jgi:hypothetical protein
MHAMYPRPRPEILSAVVEIVFISEEFFIFLAGNFK